MNFHDQLQSMAFSRNSVAIPFIFLSPSISIYLLAGSFSVYFSVLYIFFVSSSLTFSFRITLSSRWHYSVYALVRWYGLADLRERVLVFCFVYFFSVFHLKRAAEWWWWCCCWQNWNNKNEKKKNEEIMKRITEQQQSTFTFYIVSSVAVHINAGHGFRVFVFVCLFLFFDFSVDGFVLFVSSYLFMGFSFRLSNRFSVETNKKTFVKLHFWF